MPLADRPLNVAILAVPEVTASTLFGMLDLLSVIVEGLHGRTPEGWASLMVVVLLLSGVQLIMLGVLGEYLGRLFLTINDKPQFVIRDITRNDFASGSTIGSDATESLVRSNNRIRHNLLTTSR